MEAFSIDPEELAGALQRRFQSSASVTKLPGKTEMGMCAASAVGVYVVMPRFVNVLPLCAALSIHCVSTDIHFLARHIPAKCKMAEVLVSSMNAGKEIALQGDQLHNAAQYLTEVYGLPPAFVTSKNRSKG